MTLAELGRFDEAEQALHLAEEYSGGLPWVRSWLAYGLGRSGKKEEACQILTRLEALAQSGCGTGARAPFAGLFALLRLTSFRHVIDRGSIVLCAF